MATRAHLRAQSLVDLSNYREWVTTLLEFGEPLTAGKAG